MNCKPLQLRRDGPTKGGLPVRSGAGKVYHAGSNRTAGGWNAYNYPLNPVTNTDPLGLEVLTGPFPLSIPRTKSPAQQQSDDNAAKALTKWWHETLSEEDECPPCAPPAGEKYNIEIHTERHEGRGLADGAHGCMVLTGSPVHWHYDVNNQNPKTCKCYPQNHEFGGCGLS